MFVPDFKNALMYEIEEYIELNKEIAGGVPVFKGTRVTIKRLFDYLEEESLEDFLQGFPTVSREQTEGVIELAATKFLSELSV
jgi:uncharacterized protein (DUF433 family)